MEFILQLLAQLFSEPEGDSLKVAREEYLAREMKVAKKEAVASEEVMEQPELNLFNVMDFH